MVMMYQTIPNQSFQANKLSNEISLDDSELSKSLDSQTLENFKQNNCWTKGQIKHHFTVD